MDKFFRVEVFDIKAEKDDNITYLNRQKDQYMNLDNPKDKSDYESITTLSKIFKCIGDGGYYFKEGEISFRFIPITEEEYKNQSEN